MKISYLSSLSLLFGLGPLAAQTNTFPSSGNVGIGTISPGTKLQVENNGNVRISLKDSSNATGKYFQLEQDADTVYFDDAGVKPIMVMGLTSGNVGIGTTSPTQKLTISGNLNKAGSWILGDSAWGANTMEVHVNGWDGSNSLYGGIAAGHGYYYGGLQSGGNTGNEAVSGQLYVSSKSMLMGEVGIGTTSPAAKLEIQSALCGFPVTTGTSQPYASIRLGNVQTNGVLDIGVNSGSGAWLQYTHREDLSQAYPLLLNPNGGNVGIGTTSPTHKLSVNGAIRAKEVIVDTGWSDYVFDDAYRLAPLSEVEAHIKAEKHLPGIPSAAEVAEHGISVGDMQAKLLAKLEEVTLHLIRMEKENAELRQRVQTLEETR